MKLETYILAFLTLSSACSLFNDQVSENEPVARVYNTYLYKPDIINLIPHETSAKDSISFLKTYIDNWIRQQLILHQAKINLDDKSLYADIEKQLQDYHSSLIIYTYKKELVGQKLDTVVKPNEIEDYYNNNLKNFELKNNIIKAIYIKLSKPDYRLENIIRRLYRSEKEEDFIKLEELCLQFAQSFFLDDESWILFDDLLKEVPIKIDQQEQFLKYNSFIEMKDTINNIYFVNIKDYRIKASTPPLSFEKENIRNIILNQRKLKLIIKMEQSIYQDALTNNDFEIY
ncbi:MAG: hypothetical protein ABII90_03600 [Bacteroidota bacterium]